MRNLSQQNFRSLSLFGKLLYLFDAFTKWIFQTQQISSNPDLDVRKFKEEFDSTFGGDHPSFFEQSYQAAVSYAYRGPKYLLVYLHAPQHEDTERFCR